MPMVNWKTNTIFGVLYALGIYISALLGGI